MRIWNSGRPRTRPEIDDGLVLDLGRLLRLALIIPGSITSGAMVWSTILSTGNVVTKERRASVSYKADLVDAEDAGVLFTYRIDDQPQGYRVRLERTKCRFGGFRWWWICPRTGRLAYKLYLPPEATQFCSRPAFRSLAYRSELGGSMDRTHDRQRRIYEKLGDVYEIYQQGRPLRPKGMHKRTYERLIAELERAEAAHERAFAGGAARSFHLR